jgi:hypothetical protein
MERNRVRIRVLSLSLLWVMLGVIFVVMLNFSENVEAEPTEIRITWDDVDHKWPDVYGDKIVWHNICLQYN